MSVSRFGTTLSFLLLATTSAFATNPAVTIAIDATASRHAINPNIYGVAFASKTDLAALNAPLNRMGGNSMTAYNWKQNATNLAQDWYYESYPQNGGGTPGAYADSFISDTKAEGAQPMITIPLAGWVAKLGDNRAILPAFSVKKYGSQCDVDYWDNDAGDGIKPDCSTDITGNDPNDAYIPDSTKLERKWLQHLTQTWGKSKSGGVQYYLMDNEPSIWFSTHRDIHPVGPHADEYRDKVIAESASIKKLDPNAQVVATEEWGWEAYFYSGYDQQYAAEHGYCCWPDHDGMQGGMDYIPWLLSQWKTAGHPVDVLTVHFYPQGGEDSDDDSQATQLLRNRSTRQLWDPNYTSESWIDDKVYLIPRMKDWISSYYYANTPVGITEYNWGDESHINGATTQADIYGIFGREGLDMATRWTVPDSSTPTYKAMQMYRNYDGANSGFGDTSISASAPAPDDLSAFAALRKDKTMTVMVVAKDLSGTTPVALQLAHFKKAGTAQVWRLTASNMIQRMSDIAWSKGKLSDTVPSPSVTLYVLPN